MACSQVHDEEDDLKILLQKARPFLRDQLESISPALPSLISLLKSTAAGECFHKHGSFLHHLLDVHRILCLWKAPSSVCLCALFHSAYSNSYVNLAIFDPSTSRETLTTHVGRSAEHLIHLFCVIPRHSLIHTDLLSHYTDSELEEHIRDSLIHREESRPWRRKVKEVIPIEGIMTKHIKTGEKIRVLRREAAVFLLLTMADFSDQFFGFQDDLFENSNGRMEFEGNNTSTAIWPGDGKPGLWMNSVSRMAVLYNLIARDEELNTKQGSGCSDELELMIPPVFEHCTMILDAAEQIEARYLYWEAVVEKKGEVAEKLRACAEKNPFVGEPHVVLAQVLMVRERWEEAEMEARRGLKLLLEWGSAWDKRVPWEGWVAWARVVLMNSKERSWPKTPFGILNLGLVA